MWALKRRGLFIIQYVLILLWKIKIVFYLNCILFSSQTTNFAFVIINTFFADHSARIKEALNVLNVWRTFNLWNNTNAVGVRKFYYVCSLVVARVFLLREKFYSFWLITSTVFIISKYFLWSWNQHYLTCSTTWYDYL